MRRRSLILSGLAGLSACAPTTQVARPPQSDFAGPGLLDDAVISFDGRRLPLTVWPSATGDPSAVIVALHGFDDYANAFVLAGPYWAARGVTTYAYDQRGFGRGTQRGVWAGEALMVRDLQSVAALVRARHPDTPLAVVGESMGGAVAICAFASPEPPAGDRLVLLSPAVWGWGAQPVQNDVALWVAAHLVPGLVLTPPAWVYKNHHASDNIAILRRMGMDRHMIFSNRIDMLYGLVNLMQAAREAIGRVHVPTLYLYGAHDEIVPASAAIEAAAAMGSNGRSAWYAHGWHLLDRDLQADVVLADTLSFIRDPAAPLPSGAPPIPPPGAASRPGRRVVSRADQA